MKKIFNILLLAVGILAISSCKKEENIVTFNPSNVKAGTLSISANNVVLDEKNLTKDAIAFSFTKAEFGFPAGINYKLQIAPKGSSFKKPNEIGLGNLLEKKFTVKDFNNVAINGGAVAGSPNTFQARIIANVSDSIFAISNVVDFNVTPYFQLLNYPKIYVPGSYQGWAPDKAEVVASIDFSNEDYEGYINFPDPTTAFKFTPMPDWTSDWGDVDAAGNTGKLKEKGNDLKVTAPGYYYIKMNNNLLTYKVTKVSWGVLGDATPTGWNADTDMVYDAAKKTWSATLKLEGGKNFKFRANDAWDVEFGDGAKDDSTPVDGFLDYAGKDIKVSESGTYLITLDLSNPGNYVYKLEKK